MKQFYSDSPTKRKLSYETEITITIDDEPQTDTTVVDEEPRRDTMNQITSAIVEHTTEQFAGLETNSAVLPPAPETRTLEPIELAIAINMIFSAPTHGLTDYREAFDAIVRCCKQYMYEYAPSQSEGWLVLDIVKDT